ncbi:PmoA family protein [bacterium]|nr:PmoA family protein [bacterium]
MRGLSLLSLGLALVLRATGAPAGDQPSVALTPLPGKVRVEIGGRLFTEYLYSGQPRPVLYPVMGPSGIAMTRRFPLERGPAGESRDHSHHRSLWFAHGSMNGEDFWTEGGHSGRIVQEDFRIVAPDVLETSNVWRCPHGDGVCRDRRRLRFQVFPEGWLIDCEIVLLAAERDLVLGDTKEGGMAIRVADGLRLGSQGAGGRGVNSEGATGPDLWGKRARWVDYYGEIEGRMVGVAVFDHPASFRHPTWWHAREYGLLAANPFGMADFGAGPAHAGDATVPKGQSLRLRYGFFFHNGTPEVARVEAVYRRWAAP